MSHISVIISLIFLIGSETFSSKSDAGMAMATFHVVRPSAEAGSARRSHALRAAAGIALGCMAVAAVAVVVGGGNGEQARGVRAQQALFDMPSISLGFAAHEKMDTDPPLGATPQPLPAGVDPKKGTGGIQPVDIEGPKLGGINAALNFGLHNVNLTWPEHDARYIPTGAYATHYKGPYDNDYDWPDDTEVMRNDEWANSGGVGCGMSGNNC